VRRNSLFLSLLVLLICGLAVAQKAEQQSYLPLVFEENRGQAPAHFGFRAHEGTFDALFADDLVDLNLGAGRHVTLDFTGATLNLRGADALPGKVNYLRGNNSAAWLRNIPTYEAVEYPSIYPGVDLRFYGSKSKIEHDFIVQPGADATKIRMHIRGADVVKLVQSGDLEIKVGKSVLHFHKPVAYQQLASGRSEVAAKFRLGKNQTIEFELGTYDRNSALVIDPVLSFSTYLAGTLGSTIQAVATDASGNIFVTGETTSIDFPTAGAPQAACAKDSFLNTCRDAFVSKLDPTGHTLLYSTYLGGGRDEYADAIAVDANGNAIIAGYSVSTDFPVVTFQSNTCNINANCHFVASLKPDGSGFNYSGLLGATSFEYATNALALDAGGSAYLTGQTSSPTFPITPGTLGGSTTANYPDSFLFVTKFAPAGTIIYSTLVPGNAVTTFPTINNIFRPTGIQVDGSGNAVVVGNGGAGLPTTAGSLSPTFTGDANIMSSTAAFVLKLNSAATSVIFGTYIPGADAANGIALDSNGNAYVVGRTLQTNLATSANAIQKNFSGSVDCGWCSNGYIAKLSSDGSSLLAATYISGTPNLAGTSVNGVALDSNSNIVIHATTDAADFPLKNPLQARFSNFLSTTASALAILTPDLSNVTFGTFLTGSLESTFHGVTVDPSNSPILVGTTFDFDFPTTPNSYQPQAPMPASQGSTYFKGFVAKFDLSASASSLCTDSFSLDFGLVPVGATSTKTLTIKNCGNAPLQINSLTATTGLISAQHNCAAVAPGSTCTLTVGYSPTDSVSLFDTLTISTNAAVATSKVKLSGRGGKPALNFLPSSLDFGDRYVNAPGTAMAVSFFNDGDVPLIFTNFTSTGDFTIDSNDCQQPVASNDFCFIYINFVATAAGTRTGVLTLSDNVEPGTQTVALTGNGVTTYPAPVITSAQATRVSTFPLSEAINGTGFFPGSVAYWNGSARVTHFISPNKLLMDLPVEDLSTVYEASVTVTNPTPGGGTSNSFPVPVYAFLWNFRLHSSVADPATGVIYASVDSNSPTYANSVIAVDPVSRTVINQYAVGNSPNQLALSDDGTTLYVGLDATGQVEQLSLPSGTPVRTVDLNSALGTGFLVVANSLAVLPGNSQVWAVNYCATTFIPCGLGVAIFDGSTPRLNRYETSQLNNDAMTFFDSSTLIGTTTSQTPSTTWKYGIDATGVSLLLTAQNFGGPSPGGGQMQTDGTNLYVANGQVVDPTNLSVIKTFPVQQAVAQRLETSESRIFFAGNRNAMTLSSYNASTSAPLGTRILPETALGVLALNRFGSNGLDVVTTTRILFFQTALAQTIANAVQITSVTPSAILAGSPDTTLTINGTHFTNAVTVKWNGNSISSTFVSATQLTAVVPSSLLATAGDSVVTVSLSGSPDASYGVQVVNAPTITSINPSTVDAGGPTRFFTITGTNFTSNALVKWDATTISATFNSSTQLEALIPSTMIAAPGIVTISVTVPGAPTATSTVTIAGLPQASLSATSLDFGTVVVGSTSSSKTVAVSNPGSAALAITSITTNGDFSQTNTCGTSLAVGASCQITVRMTPIVSGSRSGTVVIVSNSHSGTAVVDLVGVGSDFEISGSSDGSTPTQTVKSGNPATFNIALQSSGGFNGAMVFTCSNAPTNGSCTVSPSGLPVGSSVKTVTVTVNTSSTVLAELRRTGAILAFACVMPLFFFQLKSKSNVRFVIFFTIAGILLVIAMAACGGGGSSPTPPPPTKSLLTPPGTYSVIVTATSGSTSKSTTLTVVVQ
jgi:hypothetical protein